MQYLYLTFELESLVHEKVKFYIRDFIFVKNVVFGKNDDF